LLQILHSGTTKPVSTEYTASKQEIFGLDIYIYTDITLYKMDSII